MTQKNYKAAYLIYSLDIMKNNPIALCNLGYLYSKGHGVEKVIERAETLYLNSYKLGCKQALINRFILYKNNLTVGFKFEKKLFTMLNDAIKDKNNVMHATIVERYGYKLFEGYTNDLLNKECKWIDDGLLYGIKPDDTFYIRYYFLRSMYTEKNGIFGKTSIYVKQKKVCSFDNLFVEKITRRD